MNSVLQCVAHTGPLVRLCTSVDFLKRSKLGTARGKVANALAHILRNMLWSSHRVRSRDKHTVAPLVLKLAMQSLHKQFLDNLQQDAHDFLTHLFRALCEFSVRNRKTMPPMDFVYATANQAWETHLHFELKNVHSATYKTARSFQQNGIPSRNYRCLFCSVQTFPLVTASLNTSALNN